MPIDTSVALAAPPSTRTVSWTARDVLLYHLSLGAGRDAVSDLELSYTFERDLRVLPTFAVVAGRGLSGGDEGSAPSMRMPGIDIDLRRVLHGGQALTVHRPLPAAGRATMHTRVAHVWDKIKAAVVVLEHVAVDDHGEPLWTAEMQVWARGEGGFGGEPGPESRGALPERPADLVLHSTTSPSQALLYRLNGDLNPLHIDPRVARLAGFEQPILHGLASYGIVAKALVDGLLGGDPSRLRGLTARFAGSVFPGQTIRTAVWRDGEQLTIVATCPERGGAPVLTHATAQIAH